MQSVEHLLTGTRAMVSKCIMRMIAFFGKRIRYSVKERKGKDASAESPIPSRPR